MDYRIKVALFLLLVSAAGLQAIPARKGIYTYTQPNGISFQVRLDGDEFDKRVTTLDGCAIIQDAGGYYCYAYYDIDGRKHSSGVKVGPSSGNTPAAAAARNIPYAALRARSAQMRASAAQAREARLKAFSPATKAGTPKAKALVVLAQFTDLKFTYGRSNFVNMLTGTGYRYNGATGSALEYFNDQFGGTRDFEFVVSPIVTLSKGYAYYGANGEDDAIDLKAAEGVAEACRLVDRDIDFSQFDCDGDGEVDNVFVFVPGRDEAAGAGEDHIWSHQYDIEEAGIRLDLDGKRVSTYAISTEIGPDSSSFTTIGTFCHEFSHCLGLSDLYDTDYEDSEGECATEWRTTSLMNGGNYNNNGNTPPNYNALELETLGLGKKESLELGEHHLPALSSEKRYFRAETDVEDEYFLFECRTASGWDKYIGGSGMLIYHVDKSNNPAGYSEYLAQNVTAIERWYLNEVNCFPDHQCVRLMKALPSAKDVQGVFWPNGQHDSFTPETNPSFKFWSGEIPTVSIVDIRKSGDGVTFAAVGPLAFEKVEEFQDAAIVLWTASGGVEECMVSITGPDGRVKEQSVKPYKAGCFSFTFEGLQPKTAYKVSIYTRESVTKKVSTEFTTKGYYTDGYPFIYLNSADRYSDGRLKAGSRMPLRVFNARGAAKVEWTYSSKTLSDDGSGYFTVLEGGVISARVYYEDGSYDIISKTISVK